MKISIATSYAEGSIRAIARGVSRAGMLDRFYTTAYSAKAEVLARNIPKIGLPLSKELRRRGFHDISEQNIKTVGLLPELLHVAVRRTLSGKCKSPSWLMYWVKAQFDSAVAKKITSAQNDAVIGMWGSCSKTFEASGSTCVKVVNFVNSRPAHHNNFLAKYAGLSPKDPEMVPKNVASEVEQELDLADLILVPSRFVAKQLQDYQDKVEVIPYGVDIKLFSPGEPDLRFLCDVLYVGQISHRKGISVLLEAARALPAIMFSLWGPMVSPQLLMNLPENVRYHGNLLPEDVPTAMRSAKIFVLPSFEDSYGLVTTEAMASETPVIVSDHCGVSELLRDGIDGIIVPVAQTRILVNQIAKLLGDIEGRRAMGFAARQTVETTGTWEDYSQRVIQLIIAFLRRRSRAA